MRKLLHGFKSDETLMLNYQKGDSAAFEVLYGRHKDALVAFLYRMCGQASMVEDIAQEAWMAVVRSAERYEVKASFKTYLYQIARNKMIDHWRKPKVEVLVGEDDYLLDAEDNTQNTPDQALLDTQVKGMMSRAILALPAEQREAFLLREAGFSQSDIAELVGVGGETIKSRLRYAAKHIKTKVDEQVDHQKQSLTTPNCEGGTP